MTTQIKFGTSGWRAVMAEEFTFENVRRAVRGIARYVVSQKPTGAKVIVGRDPRFLGETFCAMAAEILSAHGITPLVIAEAAPTPAIAYAVIRAGADGAINFTASHNPPEYNGIKFSTPDGAPALPEVTQRIEAEIVAADRTGPSVGVANPPQPEPLEPRRMYLARLCEIVDLDVIRKAGLRVVFDSFWGAARGYSDELLREAGVSVESVHDCRDVLFGGHAPEPDDHLLEDCRRKMRESRVEERRGQVRRHDQSDQRSGRAPQGGAARDAGRVQVHRRADQGGQDLHRRRGERGVVDSASRPGEGWGGGRTALLRDGSAPGQTTSQTACGTVCQSRFLLSAAGELPLDGGGKGEVH